MENLNIPDGAMVIDMSHGDVFYNIKSVPHGDKYPDYSGYAGHSPVDSFLNNIVYEHKMVFEVETNNDILFCTGGDMPLHSLANKHITIIITNEEDG